jgi:hypothetical protein
MEAHPPFNIIIYWIETKWKEEKKKESFKDEADGYKSFLLT